MSSGNTNTKALIHLVGSEGFIGAAVQREATRNDLHCWSHNHHRQSHRFNLLEPNSWETLLNYQPKVIIFLSWPGLPNYEKDFHLTRNLPAAIELFKKLSHAGLKRLVVAGTCYEYGLQNGSLRESGLTDPINSYAIAKDSLRRWLVQHSKRVELEWTWLRIFYPIGVGQNPNSLLPSLEHAIESCQESFPMSSGRQLRDFIKVETVAQQLLLLATHPKAKGVYNGGTGKPISIRELVEARIEKNGSPIKLKLGSYPEREDEPLSYWSDMTRMDALQSLPPDLLQ
mgnify:CR=1 FL=1